MWRVRIERNYFHESTKRDGSGKTYSQTAWVYQIDRDGVEDAYPTKFTVYLQVNDHGKPVPYDVGEYTIHPSSLRTNNNRLEIGFVRLTPVKSISAVKTA